LHEYACRQWSGLLNDFYKVRWEKFFAEIKTTMNEGKEVDVKAFENTIRKWEWQWVNGQKRYPVGPVGNSITEARVIYQKYRKLIGAAYEN